MPNHDYLPDYQRGTVAFIDAQIAHLDDQRKRLVEARDYLASLTLTPGNAPPIPPSAVPPQPPPPEPPTPPEPLSADSRIDPRWGIRATPAEMSEVERRLFVLMSAPDYLPRRLGLLAREVNAVPGVVRSCLKGRPALFECVGVKLGAVWRLRDAKGDAVLPSDYERVRRVLANGPRIRRELTTAAGISDVRLSAVLAEHGAAFHYGPNGYELVPETERRAG